MCYTIYKNITKLKMVLSALSIQYHKTYPGCKSSWSITWLHCWCFLLLMDYVIVYRGSLLLLLQKSTTFHMCYFELFIMRYMTPDNHPITAHASLFDSVTCIWPLIICYLNVTYLYLIIVFSVLFWNYVNISTLSNWTVNLWPNFCLNFQGMFLLMTARESNIVLDTRKC